MLNEWLTWNNLSRIADSLGIITAVPFLITSARCTCFFPVPWRWPVPLGRCLTIGCRSRCINLPRAVTNSGLPCTGDTWPTSIQKEITHDQHNRPIYMSGLADFTWR